MYRWTRTVPRMSNQRWDFDLTHSGVHFSVRHLVVSKVRGQFKQWGGTLELDPSDPTTAKAVIEIDAASIDTNEPRRDEHLRSGDFLLAAEHPKLRFVSGAIERAGDGHYKVHGDLTIRGVTRPVVLKAELSGTVTDPWGGQRVGFTLATSIDRKDFGVSWNQALDHGGVAVGDKVEISIEIEAIAAKAEPKAKAG
jgi:polyisoprenoid-binding protein YceI